MIPNFHTWTDQGKTFTQIDGPTKRAILASYAVRYQLGVLIETGTCNGDCLLTLKGLFWHCVSIELDEKQYDFTLQKLAPYPHLYLLQGDSAILLPKILAELKEPALFWLDAHGENWIGPIVKELEAIFATNAKGAILIDDMDYITDTLPTDPRWQEESREYGIVRLLNV